MSKKTEQFNVTVKVGKKTYRPGDPVPVGTGGITVEEAENFRKNFGAFTAGPEATSAAPVPSVDLDRLREAIEKLSADNDKLSADNATLAAEVTKLQAEIENLKAPK